MPETFGKRPRALAEVARRGRAGAQAYASALREFLDDFYVRPDGRAAALVEVPEPLGQLEDAYLAATAEHLARAYGLPVPSWTEEDGRALRRPFFAGGKALMAILLVESPSAFRRRQIFVSANALDRASMYAIAD